MQFCLEPVDGIAHHVGRDEVAQVIIDDGLGLDVIALGRTALKRKSDLLKNNKK